MFIKIYCCLLEKVNPMPGNDSLMIHRFCVLNQIHFNVILDLLKQIECIKNYDRENNFFESNLNHENILYIAKYIFILRRYVILTYIK